MARDYALGRYAFGRPIGSYQAIKHKLADIYIKKTQRGPMPTTAPGRSALALQNSRWPPLARALQLVRPTGSLPKENIQTHGGMGYTWDADCHLYYRRAVHLSLVAGATSHWKELTD